MSDAAPDDWMLQSAPPASPEAAPQSAPPSSAPAGDPAVWTVLGEAGSDPEGQRAVASTIANRQKGLGYSSPQEVIADPNAGYESWQSRADKIRSQYPVGSPAYVQAQKNVGDILSGSAPAPYPYTHFYAPKLQASLGRQPPAWDDGTGVNIGGNVFFTKSMDAPAGLTPEQRADWEDTMEKAARDVRISSTAGTPEPGKPTDEQAKTVRFLEAQKFRDVGSPQGSSTNPLAETASSGPPTTPGTYYVDKGGALRAVGANGKPGDDFMPFYQQLASERAQAAAKPWVERAGLGAAQGGYDVAASVNRLTGGGLAVTSDNPMGSALYDIYNGGNVFDRAKASLQQDVDQRNAYDLLHGPDAVASAGRIAGQTAVTAPFLGVGERVGAAILDAAGAAVPKMAGALDYLGGRATTTNPLALAGSRVLPGAVQGAQAGALTSSTTDRPVSDSVKSGAAFGAAAGASVPVLDAVGSKISGGFIGPHIPAPVLDLASKARDTYGIPLRTSQIIGTVDRGAAIRDSEMLSQPATGFPSNNAAQKTAFTRAVAKTFGADTDTLTPSVMDKARKDLGAQFDAFAQSHSIPDADRLLTRLRQVVHDAQQVMPDSEVKPLLNQVQNIGDLVQPVGQGRPGSISGEAYQRLIAKGSPLDRALQAGDSNLRYYAGQIKDALDDGMAQSATPDEMKAFSNLRLQYKNLMTVKGLAAKAGVTGEISPVQLQGMVNRSFDDRAFSGAGPLGELADIGQTFMKEPPNSGTAPRLISALKNNALGLGVGGSALADLSFLHDPTTAARLGITAGALGLGRLAGESASGAYNNSDLRTRMILDGQKGLGLPAALRGIGVKLNDVLGPAYVPAAALTGIQLSHPRIGSQ